MALSIATWNINSVRLRMPLVEQFLEKWQPDILCLQETKAKEGQAVVDLPEGAEVTVGRSRGATLSFPGDERLSRIHVLLRRDGEQVAVEDQGSRNGTRINGQTVTGTGHASAGDAIDAGGLTVSMEANVAMARR